MKTLAVHENLDTSFVNLSALLRYLRERKFAGNVRVQLDDYEAEITLDENQTTVREHDHVAGRVAEGEEALQRILIRARAPGGTISVYQFSEETASVFKQTPNFVENVHAKPVVQKEIRAQVSPIVSAQTNGASKTEKTNGNKVAPPTNQTEFPLEFSNRVEEKARRGGQIAPEEWHVLLQLTGELLGAVDKVLAASKLDFNAAFNKARAEIAADYPFMNPASGAFEYADGKVSMPPQTSAKLFAASINESLRRILEKLGANPKFAETYRAVVQKILAIVHHRKPLYDKFLFTPQIEKILGV